MTRFSQIASCLMCTALTFALTGCATFHYPFEKKIAKATAGDPAVQILCLWQQAEGRDPEGYPCKGFSGQILFLSSKASTPVQVDGDVRVYLFDDQGTEEEQSKPLRQFDFDSGSWNVHLMETSLGPTYGVFIPYVRRGTKDANCALRVRLKPKQGPAIFSELSNMPLNGNKKPVMGEEAKPITDEENDRMAGEALAAKLRRTTTISMGSNPKTTESIAGIKQDASVNQVSLASHQVVSDAPKESADAERIQRLEAMVQQLLEQKSNLTVDTAPANPPRRTIQQLGLDDAIPVESRTGAPAPVRLKLTPRQGPTSRERDEAEPVQSVEPVRQKHPLDD